MKVAIISQHSSAGGGTRFIRALIFALIKKYPNLEIGFFTESTALKRDKVHDLFKNYSNIKVIPLDKVPSEKPLSERKPIKRNTLKDFLKKSKLLVKAVKFARFRILKKNPWNWYIYKPDEETVKRLNQYDVVYLSWPYFIEPVEITSPLIATFHDFNFKHKFGNFEPETLEIVNRQIPKWIELCHTAVVSTKFIESELDKFYPNKAKNKSIIYLSTFNITAPSEIKVKEAIKKFNLPERYIICPANTSLHKNLKKLFSAFGILKQRKENLPLVLVGFGTDEISLFKRGGFSQDDPRFEYFRMLDEAIDKANLEIGKDLYILGHVTDKEIDALIAGAQLVVSTSLYEAGSGSGLDAWMVKTPVAFSNIPPFLEQLEFLKTKAWIFDPNDPKDIADKINKAITQKDVSQEMARESKEAIDKYTWDDVASRYYEVFRKAYEDNKDKGLNQ